MNSHSLEVVVVVWMADDDVVAACGTSDGHCETWHSTCIPHSIIGTGGGACNDTDIPDGGRLSTFTDWSPVALSLAWHSSTSALHCPQYNRLCEYIRPFRLLSIIPYLTLFAGQRHPVLRPQHGPSAHPWQTSRSIELLWSFGKPQEEKPMDITQRIQWKSKIFKDIFPKKH